MTVTQAEAEAARDLGRELVTSRPFGAWQPIRSSATTLYSFGMELFLERIFPDEPGGARAAQMTPGMVHDPLLRASLDAAFGDLRRGAVGPGHGLGEMLDWIRTLPPPAGPDHGPVLHALHGVGLCRPSTVVPGLDVAVWGQSTRVDPVLRQRFQDLVEGALSTPERQVHLLDADASVLAQVEAGLEVCEQAVPGLVHNAMRHVALVAVVDGRHIFQSASLRAVPGVVFVQRAALATPLGAAETLLHEATHHKLYDLYTTRTILTPGYDDERAPVVVAAWNPAMSAGDSNRWPVDRALAAFHVYVHLAALFTAPGPRSAGARAATATDRADYLGRHLAEIGSRGLGADGVRMVEALRATLARVSGRSGAPEQRGGK